MFGWLSANKRIEMICTLNISNVNLGEKIIKLSIKQIWSSEMGCFILYLCHLNQMLHNVSVCWKLMFIILYIQIKAYLLNFKGQCCSGEPYGTWASHAWNFSLKFLYLVSGSWGIFRLESKIQSPIKS